MTIIVDDELKEATETFTIQVQEVIPILSTVEFNAIGMVTVYIEDNDDPTQEICFNYFQSYFHYYYYYNKKYY